MSFFGGPGPHNATAQQELERVIDMAMDRLAISVTAAILMAGEVTETLSPPPERFQKAIYAARLIVRDAKSTVEADRMR